MTDTADREDGRRPRPWVAHYDLGVPGSITYPEHPIFHFLDESARKYPGHPCTIFNDTVTSYGRLLAAANQLSAALAALGIKKGDRVGLLMPNTPQFIMAFYGILKAGGVVVATNALYAPAEIAHQVNDSGLEIMFVMSDLYQTLKVAQPATGIKRWIVARIEDGVATSPPTSSKEQHGRDPGAGIEAQLSGGDLWMHELLTKHQFEQPPQVDIGPDDTALFQYSGGTTGISKAAVASHRGVVANTIQFRTWLAILEEAKEVVLMAIPLYHAYGMIAGMSLGIALGGSLALVPNARNSSDLLRTISKHRPTVFPGVPSLYSAISNHPGVRAGEADLSSIKVCISGSSALLRATKETFERLTGGKICEGYGLSEAPVVTHCNPLHGANKIGSIGLPMPDVDCRIVDLEDGETDVRPQDSGELVLRGPQVMKGYHNMPAETGGALRTLKDGKTWLFTGDIVRMDEDGYFYIVDRKKELIKPGGFQVWPREVEEAIASHPAVLEVGVAGIPDSERGEVVKAWIVLRPGMEVMEEEIRSWCRRSLASFKVPGQIEFRTELPKSAVGKVLRRELVRLKDGAGNKNT